MGRFLLFFALLGIAAPVAARHPIELALTFDDLPAHGSLVPGETRLGIARKITAAVKAAHSPPAFGFANAADLADDRSAELPLRAWHEAGFPVGNHSWSHLDLNDVSAAAFEADIARDAPEVRRFARHGSWRWFRYPYLSEGDDPAKRAEVRRFLGRHGYRIAAANVDFGDYQWNEAYARCAARGDWRAVAGLETSYLAAARQSMDYSQLLARRIYGRDIPYVLLLHVGAFDARMMPRLLAQYRAEGVHFVSLPHAERDPAYRSDVDPSLPGEPWDLQDQAIARNIPAPDPGDWGQPAEHACV